MSEPTLRANPAPQDAPVTPLQLTTRFTEAINFARSLHQGARKGCAVPVMAHLLGVCAVALGEHGEHGVEVTEDIAIAALLHDSAEDHGGEAMLTRLERTFGADVARVVRECSDSLEPEGAQKREWRVRKEEYIARVRHMPADSRLVVTADKVHNTRATLADYREHGDAVWARFKRGRDGELWYLREMARALSEAGPNRLTEELERGVEEVEKASTFNDAADPSTPNSIGASAKRSREVQEMIDRMDREYMEGVRQSAKELKEAHERGDYSR